MNAVTKVFRPIITSLLDTDFYKLTMMQFYFFYYRSVEAEFAFKIRTKGVRQADIIPFDAIKEQLDFVSQLTFTSDEINYLRSLRGKSGALYFREEFLEFLGNYHLSPYTIKIIDGNYDIRSKGTVMNSMLWETLVMSIDNELYYDYLPGLDWDMLYVEGRKRLAAKIAAWQERPHMPIVDFGSRRRRSAAWHDEVARTMAQGLGTQLLGVSNVFLAKKYGLEPKGTMAHELFMIAAGVSGETDEGLRNSCWTVARNWLKLHPDLDTILPDTFGTRFFFRNIPQDLAVAYWGYRHDSEDPIWYTNQVLAFLDERKLSPVDKAIPFSDGVTGESSIMIDETVTAPIAKIYCPGTDLTNDFGISTLSIVMKAVRANGKPLVKLSDNPAKATGEDADEINRYRRVYGNNVEDHAYVECKS